MGGLYTPPCRQDSEGSVAAYNGSSSIMNMTHTGPEVLGHSLWLVCPGRKGRDVRGGRLREAGALTNAYPVVPEGGVRRVEGDRNGAGLQCLQTPHSKGYLLCKGFNKS